MRENYDPGSHIIVRTLRNFVLKLVKTIAFLPFARGSIRAFLSSRSALRTIELVEAKGHYGLLAALSTEAAPQGALYLTSSGVSEQEALQLGAGAEDPFSDSAASAKAHLRDIRNPQINHLLPRATIRRLLQNKRIARTHASRYQYSTRAQRSYDDQHQVRHRLGVYFSLRGNTKSPKRIIITFSNVNDLAEEVRYPLNHLSRIADVELRHALIVAIQPRMDDAVRFSGQRHSALSHRFVSFVEGILERFGLEDGAITWLAEDGLDCPVAALTATFHASSSIIVCRNGALATPAQIPYSDYYRLPTNSKPNTEVAPGANPTTIATDFLIVMSDDSRKFTTLDSNTKSRSPRQLVIADFASEREQLWATAEATIYTLLRYKLGICDEASGSPVTELRTYIYPTGTAFQIRVDHDWTRTPSVTQWFLEISLNNGIYLKNLSDHRLPFVKYTNSRQQLALSIGDPHHILGARSFNTELGITHHSVEIHARG